MKRLIPLLLAAGLCVPAVPAAAQETITLSTWGTGDLVQDELGLFGAPGTAPVDDVAFTLSIALDTTGMWRDIQPGYAWFLPEGSGPRGLTGELTANGQTWQWSIERPDASAFFSRPSNSVDMFTRGIDTASGYDASVYELLNPDASAPQFVLSDDYRDPVSFTDVRNERDHTGSYFLGAQFRVTGNLPCAICPGGMRQGLTWFLADEPTNARWTVSAVPEPSAWMLLAGGIAALAVARGRVLGGKLLASAR